MEHHKTRMSWYASLAFPEMISLVQMLVPPGAPQLFTSAGLNPSVAVGESVLVSCQTRGGNPTPSLSLYIGGEIVAKSDDGEELNYRLEIKEEHDGAQLQCGALNSMVYEIVPSQMQVIRLKCK